jgi:colanic acid biosynthesis glycosyl transferase WcaI
VPVASHGTAASASASEIQTDERHDAVRAVVLSQWFPPEKAAIPEDIARGLAEHGHEVTVLTGFPNYPTGRIYDDWRQRPWLDGTTDGYRVRRVALYPSHDSSPARRAAGYFSFGATSTAFGWRKLRAADVVYVYHPPLTAATGPWISRSFGGAPYVLHVQDLWPESVIEAGMIHGRALGLANRWLTGACNTAYQRAAGVICIAPTMATTLGERGVPEEKLHVVPNWADESVFFPTPRNDSVAHKLGLAGSFNVMFAGNLGHLQALDVAIRAAHVVADLRDFQLVLVGDGIARASLEELARSLGVGNVLFVPSQPMQEMNAITHAADVQLVSLRDLPLFRGTIPSKLGAVMASGLPVICAVDGDAGRLVGDSGGGWPCAAEDVAAMARAFRAAYASPSEQLAEYGAAGRRYYGAHLARRVGVGRVEEVLIGACRGRS